MWNNHISHALINNLLFLRYSYLLWLRKLIHITKRHIVITYLAIDCYKNSHKYFYTLKYVCLFIIPPPNEVGGWVYGIHLSPSVGLSVRPFVCRRHGFRSISQVSFGISISNFICMLMVAIGRSLLIFSDVTPKMAAWRPYWIFWFPDCNFTLALNIDFTLQRHKTYVYG